MKHLRELGFSPDSVARMRRSRGGAPMSLILVKLSNDQKNMYNLKELVSLDVSIETLRANPMIGQCYRCQRYDHAQYRCTAPRKCASCGGEHPSGDCPRPKSEPPTCANCGDTHPANYRSCTRCPKPKAAPPRATQMPKRTATTASKIQPGKSFSKAVAAPTWTEIQGGRSRKPQKGRRLHHIDPGQKAKLPKWSP